MMSTVLADAQRRFLAELNGMMNRRVVVYTRNGVFKGKLVAVDQQLNIILSEVEAQDGEHYQKALITFNALDHVLLKEGGVDLSDFARYLEKYFPGMVKYIEEANIVAIGDRVRVTEAGVEGSGPLAERVKRILDEYFRSR